MNGKKAKAIRKLTGYHPGKKFPYTATYPGGPLLSSMQRADYLILKEQYRKAKRTK